MTMELLFPLLILLLFIPIFLSGRRQRRAAQEMQKMQAALEAGDVVITTSGLRGTIVDASYEDTLDIEIADGVVTTWVRAAVREKVNPATTEEAPVEETPASAEESASEQSTAPSLEKDESSNGTARS
jgi:preprotein translocase subunit YajC